MWPAALVAVALVLPIFIDTIAHPELATGIVLTAFAAFAAASIVRREPIISGRPLDVTLIAFVGYLALRSLFAPEPAVAYFGAYNSDATVWVFTCTVVALLGSAGWRATLPSSGTAPALTAIVAAVALYAAASSAAAWQWNSTDGMGGPPSGFTANSQYQLQLLLLGLACALTWAWLTRSRPLVAAVALLTGAGSIVGIYLCRAASTYPALLAAVAVGGLLALASRRGYERVMAAAGTAIVALLGGGTVLALSTGSTASRLVELLDRFGGSRGTLWASAADVFRSNLLVGRGLAHSTSVTRWALNGDTMDLTTTVDPHNLFLTLGIGGGLAAIVLALTALYTLLLRIAGSMRGLAREEAIARILVVSGAAAVFVVAQFAFVYPVAWVLAAVLLGASGALATPAQPDPTTRGPRIAVALTAVPIVLSAALVVGAATFVAPRIASLHLSFNAGQTDPAALLGSQLALITRSSDVMPTGSAIDVVAQGLRANGPAATPFVTSVRDKVAVVSQNAVWDARLAAAELDLWAASALVLPADSTELERIVAAGIEADPGSGLWASAGASLASRYGFDEQAAKWAADVRDDPEWYAQLKRGADPQTVTLIEGLRDR